jgi:hypothetical protein
MDSRGWAPYTGPTVGDGSWRNETICNTEIYCEANLHVSMNYIQ